MKIGHIAKVETNLEDADFWITRHGDVIRKFNPKHVGLKVIDTKQVLPDYLFYALQYYLEDQNIKDLTVGDIAYIELTPT